MIALNKAQFAGTGMASPSPVEEMPEGEVCIANISPAERMKRLRFAIVSAAVWLVALVALVALAVSPWWRLALFPILATAAICTFEWRDKTCVKLVMENSRFTGDHQEKIQDMSELAQVRRQSTRIYVKSILTSLVITLLTLAIP